MEEINLSGALSFEWDEGNELKNWIKHKVSEKEAEEAFNDAKRLMVEDIKHSKQEKRVILFGKIKQGKKLFIVFTMRGKHNENTYYLSKIYEKKGA